MTDKEHIKDLLERYWAAESSLEEERELLAEPDNGEAGVLLDYFAKQRQIKPAQDVQLPYAQKKAKVVPLRRRLSAIAAVAAVVVGLVFFLRPVNQNLQASSVVTADEAYEELTQALYFISHKMNSGLLTADASLQKVEPIQEIFK